MAVTRITRRMGLALFSLVFTLISGIKAQSQSPVQKEPGTAISGSTRSEKAVQDWRDRKFSMFIHFGLYSVPAGMWNGEKVTIGYSEQIRAHGKIPKEDYRKLAEKFNPTAWDPDSVALLAKRAGMKSIVFTTKHHDGFAMYHTRHSTFNIVDATPYKRDIVKELAEACRRHGLHFGVYFSLIDWDFPGALPISSHNSDSIPPSHHRLNLYQVRELMTKYGPISEIWFDMGKPTAQQSRELAELVRKYQPDCMISGRLWNDMGDFAVMGDNNSPDFLMGTDWQTPASMFDETWGYRSWQGRGDPLHKAAVKTAALANVVSNGGNYLLNIGPKGDGSVVPFERDVLLAMGKWMQQHGAAIYGTSPTPLPAQDWGLISGKDQKLFLFLTKPPRNGEIIIKGLRSRPAKIYHMANPSAKLPFATEENQCRVDISQLQVSELLTVLVLEYAGELDYQPSKIVDTPYVLNASNAIDYHSFSGQDYYTTKPTVIKRQWYLRPAETRTYKLSISSGTKDKGRRFTLRVDNEIISVVLTGKSDQPLNKTIRLESRKPHTIQISLTDQSNIHQDMEADGIVVTLY